MPPSADIPSRKSPLRTRSDNLVAAILDAAVQVLTAEGAVRFTTARVAERAGVAAPRHRDAPEAAEAKAGGKQAFVVSVAELLPDASEAEHGLHTDLIERTLSEVGASFSETPGTLAEIGAYAEALADRLCGHLERLR